MSLPLCVKRMQFLSLPQWCSAWSVPESTWCGVTGGATPPRAWTSTTQSTARQLVRARRTRSTSGGLMAWDTMHTTTHTHRVSVWELWEQEVAHARSSSPCHLGAACPTLVLTGTRSSRCSPLRNDWRGRLLEKVAAHAHAHTVRSEMTWTEFAKGMNNTVSCSHSQPCPMPISMWKTPVLTRWWWFLTVVSYLFRAGAGSIFFSVKMLRINSRIFNVSWCVVLTLT